MRDVLCIYYSRTGNTKRVMETIAKEMDAELLALTDGVERSGLRGWLRSGMDAMRKDCPDVLPFETERKLENYRLVIVGTPVWAGRCSRSGSCWRRRNSDTPFQISTFEKGAQLCWIN